MMKRSDRLVGITNYFINHPRELVRLTYFTDKYHASKSSISEDVNIIHEQFKREGIGSIEPSAGVAGGVMYIPYFDKAKSKETMLLLSQKLQDPARILPGGYVYMSDILGDPTIVQEIAKAFVTAFGEQEFDAVVTVETKGIPLAYAVVQYLHVPVVIIRKNMRVTEESLLSINYVSGRSQRIPTLVLPTSHSADRMSVCFIDDFV